MASLSELNFDQLPLCVTTQGELIRSVADSHFRQRALLPGSFNPIHHGHWQLAAVAERLLGCSVEFELSVSNVDKPEVSVEEVRRRLGPFAGAASVWITRAPLFTQKAALFPGAAFVIGADTAARLVQPRYYHNDSRCMVEALAQLRDQGCRFLVAARAGSDGTSLTLGDLNVPEPFRDLFSSIAPELFLCDASSTALRDNHL